MIWLNCFLFISILPISVKLAEISCWGILQGDDIRLSVIYQNLERLKDPRCVIITSELAWIPIPFRNDKVFCPRYVLNTDKNRELLKLKSDNVIINSHYSDHIGFFLLQNDYCKTISISSEFDIDESILCRRNRKYKQPKCPTCSTIKRIEIFDGVLRCNGCNETMTNECTTIFTNKIVEEESD